MYSLPCIAQPHRQLTTRVLLATQQQQNGNRIEMRRELRKEKKEATMKQRRTQNNQDPAPQSTKEIRKNTLFSWFDE